MKILLGLAVVTSLLLVYALWGRSWLKSKPWAVGFFAWVEPVEIALFKKSETILAARTLSALGALLTFLTQIGDINLAAITPFVPEKYQAFVTFGVNCLPLLISAVGWMVEKLRAKVTKPLELVAVPDKVIAENPVIAQAVADAEVAKVEAVAEVKAA